jgi:hypothetical protein
MDLLLPPPSYTNFESEVPFVAAKWDLGPFPTFLRRFGVKGITDSEAVEFIRSLQLNDGVEKINQPVKLEAPQFFQTWFFFGLAAEFLGLNEQVNGKRVIDYDLASKYLDELYTNSIYIRDGKQFISGQFILESFDTIIGRLKLSITKKQREERGILLSRCLEITRRAYNSSPMVELNWVSAEIRYPVEALVEFLAHGCILSNVLS